jgi:hypothetical protein
VNPRMIVQLLHRSGQRDCYIKVRRFCGRKGHHLGCAQWVTVSNRLTDLKQGFRIDIPAASVVAAIQTPMRSFRVIDDASTARGLLPHYSRNARFQCRNDVVVRAPHLPSVRQSIESGMMEGKESSSSRPARNKWPALLPRLPSRTFGPRYQRFRHGRLPSRRASRCRRSRRRKPQRGRRPKNRSCHRRRGSRCPCANTVLSGRADSIGLRLPRHEFRDRLASIGKVTNDPLRSSAGTNPATARLIAHIS